MSAATVHGKAKDKAQGKVKAETNAAMKVELRAEPFDPWTELRAYQDSGREHGLPAGKYGATGIFVGSLRDFNDGATVEAMFLEHYPEMTLNELRGIGAAAAGKWALLDALILHRVGWARTGEAIVLVAVWAAHRGDAMDACRFIIEKLKHQAPFWKKEKLPQGERWVEGNTGGYGAADSLSGFPLARE